ncbi:hypothetical protein GA0070558_10479 [Micromonospora haikouensis]|uniref:Uncharacterized protein n=1 Tax=Micromonospora haikouensis TaxID=686309 RepID=A0A1C4ULR3_9ACTN|nr:hypothetical protein [Micromonospora haikouensis]SCE72580.1 hypothetical protein GA0070558_10479 [Micromonospora haikouensis]
MAFRTWGKPLSTALGVSMLAGAGQLGVAYGFGIVRIAGDFTDATVNRWPAQLVWVGWCAALAAVVGAVVTERLVSADPVTGTTTGRLALAGAAALGATVVAPLCMQPARATQLNSVDPVWAMGICATLGAVVGAGAALAVLLRPPLGWNVAAVAGTVWFVALVSALPALAGTGPLPTVRLGVFEPGWLAADAAQGLATIVLPLVALLAGAASGALARRRGHPPLIAGATGAAGPVLVAFAYLTAGPGDSADRYQLAPYYGALLAVATGLLGATAAALARWPLFARSTSADPLADGPAGVDPAAGVPAADLARAGGAPLPGALGSRPPGTLRAALSGMRAAGLTRGRGVGLPGSPRTGGQQGAIEPTDILRPLPTGPTPPVAGDADGPDGPADLAAPPGVTTARRVPATIGDPLPDDRTGDAARSGRPRSRGDEGRVGVDGPAGAPPAHWEWPMASGTTAARPTDAARTTDAARNGTGEAAGTGEATGPTDATGTGGATDPTPSGGVVDTTPAGEPAAAQAGEPVTLTQAGGPATFTQAGGPATFAEAGEAAGPAQAGEVAAAGQVPAQSAGEATSVSGTGEAAGPALTGGLSDPVPTGGLSDPVPTGELIDPALTGQATEPALRPRPRLPLPDLDQAASWDAFGNAARRFARPASERHVVGDTQLPRGEPGEPGEPGGLWQAAARTTGAAPADGAGPAPAGEPGAALPADAGTSPDDAPAGRSRLLRPLFRRGRTRAGDDVGPAAERDDRHDPEPLPAQDEEYVDWVTGLARPVSGEDGGSTDADRRSLRPSGRHHRD